MRSRTKARSKSERAAIQDVDTAQARDMLDWFGSTNEFSDVELPEGVEVEVDVSLKWR